MMPFPKTDLVEDIRVGYIPRPDPIPVYDLTLRTDATTSHDLYLATIRLFTLLIERAGGQIVAGEYQHGRKLWRYRLNLIEPPFNFVLSLAERWHTYRSEAYEVKALYADMMLDNLQLCANINLSVLSYRLT